MKRSSLNRFLLLIGVAMLVLSGCSHRRRAGAIPPEKLEAVLYDYHLAQVMVNDLPSSERYKKDLYFDYVYSKHKVTKAEIDSSLVYYARYPKDLSTMYVKLSKRIEADIQRIESENRPLLIRKPVPVEGDSADLWYDMRVIEMTTSPLANKKYSFAIPTDTNFMAGDHLVWSGKAMFLHDEVDSLSKYLYLNLRVEYANDSIVNADTLLYASGGFVLEVSDTAVVRSIDGTAYLKSGNASERLLIMAPTLMRYRYIEQLPDSLSADSLGVDSLGIDSLAVDSLSVDSLSVDSMITKG